MMFSAFGDSAGGGVLRKTLPQDFAQHGHGLHFLLGAQREPAPMKVLDRRAGLNRDSVAMNACTVFEFQVSIVRGQKLEGTF
jgi:hypothetical protein